MTADTDDNLAVRAVGGPRTGAAERQHRPGAAGGRRAGRGRRSRLMTHRPRPGAALYPGAAGACSPWSGCSRCSPSPPASSASPDRTRDDPVMRPIADHAYRRPGGHRCQRGRVVYANAAYLALTGAAGPQDVRPVERVFIGDPDVSEAVFRLLKAAREGKRQQEEVRVAGARRRARPLAADAGAAARRRASARRNARCGRSPTSRATASGRRTCSRNCSTRSTISIMRRAASSRSMPAGELVYLNATLAELARPRSGPGRLRRPEARPTSSRAMARRC